MKEKKDKERTKIKRKTKQCIKRDREMATFKNVLEIFPQEQNEWQMKIIDEQIRKKNLIKLVIP